MSKLKTLGKLTCNLFFPKAQFFAHLVLLQIAKTLILKLLYAGRD